MSEKFGVDLNRFESVREPIGSYKDACRITEFTNILGQYLDTMRDKAQSCKEARNNCSMVSRKRHA